MIALTGDIHPVVYPRWGADASDAQRMEPLAFDTRCPSKVNPPTRLPAWTAAHVHLPRTMQQLGPKTRVMQLAGASWKQHPAQACQTCLRQSTARCTESFCTCCSAHIPVVKSSGLVLCLGEMPVAETNCVLQLPESLRIFKDHKEGREEL